MLEKPRWLAPPQDESRTRTAATRNRNNSAYSSHKPRCQHSYQPAICTFYRLAGEPGHGGNEQASFRREGPGLVLREG